MLLAAAVPPPSGQTVLEQLQHWYWQPVIPPQNLEKARGRLEAKEELYLRPHQHCWVRVSQQQTQADQ